MKYVIAETFFQVIFLANTDMQIEELYMSLSLCTSLVHNTAQKVLKTSLLTARQSLY